MNPSPASALRFHPHLKRPHIYQVHKSEGYAAHSYVAVAQSPLGGLVYGSGHTAKAAHDALCARQLVAAERERADIEAAEKRRAGRGVRDPRDPQGLVQGDGFVVPPILGARG